LFLFLGTLKTSSLINQISIKYPVKSNKKMKLRRKNSLTKARKLLILIFRRNQT